MKAYMRYNWGGPEELKLQDIEKPSPKEDEILVKIKALSINPADWHRLRGKPYFMRIVGGIFKPKNKLIGADFAGIVETVGANIQDISPGDEVFGEASLGCFAEFNCVNREMIAQKPSTATFEQAACLGIAGLTALQGLMTHGELKSGERVLINGASGGVGHYAVQIASSIGAEVTAICSEKNKTMVASLGADKVIDYTKTNVHQLNGDYDLVMDVHGNLRYSSFKKLGKRGVMIGFTSFGLFFGNLLKKNLGNFPLKTFTAQVNKIDLNKLADLYDKGKIKTVIDRRYSFQQLPKAITYIEKMHTSGKVALYHE